MQCSTKGPTVRGGSSHAEAATGAAAVVGLAAERRESLLDYQETGSEAELVSL